MLFVSDFPNQMMSISVLHCSWSSWGIRRSYLLARSWISMSSSSTEASVDCRPEGELSIKLQVIEIYMLGIEGVQCILPIA